MHLFTSSIIKLLCGYIFPVVLVKLNMTHQAKDDI